MFNKVKKKERQKTTIILSMFNVTVTKIQATNISLVGTGRGVSVALLWGKSWVPEKCNLSHMVTTCHLTSQCWGLNLGCGEARVLITELAGRTSYAVIDIFTLMNSVRKYMFLYPKYMFKILEYNYLFCFMPRHS